MATTTMLGCVIPTDQEILCRYTCQMLTDRGYSIKFSQVPAKGLKPIGKTTGERKKKTKKQAPLAAETTTTVPVTTSTRASTAAPMEGVEVKATATFSDMLALLTPLLPQVIAIAEKPDRGYVIVLYDTRKTAIGVAPLRQYAEMIRASGEQIRHIIVIYESDLTSQSISNSQDSSDPHLGGIRWEFREKSRSLFRPIESDLAARSDVKLTEAEILEHERKKDLKRNNFPKASISTHPCAQYRGWQPGDVIRSQVAYDNGPDDLIRLMVP